MKTREELFTEAAEVELYAVERQYTEAQQRLGYLAVNGTDNEFNDQWALTEKIRNNLNWLRSVRK